MTLSKTGNRLIGERSPYLLQHAYNPVDWYPWGEAAFEKARRENKPIFLSVGYSTCHWCHVMARESFENEEIAALLNAHFVAIKVDREERPDIDRVYMTYVQAATGEGGWPMSVWLTPDLLPFLGGTYFPPEDKWGRPGFKTVLRRVAELWASDRPRIVAAAEEAMRRLREAASSAADPAAPLPPEILDRACAQIKAAYDERHGGFGGAPKFPRPVAPDFLLRCHARRGAREPLAMTLHTLRAMAEGGLYDQLGGGFHRYSVDERWRVPHFEKMLYDQAQLARLYLDAFQIARDPFFERIARETLDYVRRDLTGPEGQFYSAEDADSAMPGGPPGEHGEGAFYVWTQDEIVRALGSETAAVFSFRYGVEPDGNVRHDPHGEFEGKNILYLARSIEETAARFGLTPAAAEARLEEGRAQLFARRERRPRPHRDDKTLTAWNGLALSAFARAHQVLGDPKWLDAAARAAAFLRERLYDEAAGALFRCYRAGAAAVGGVLEDYAFLIGGLLDLYEADFDPRHLEWALQLQRQQDARFWDSDGGGYFTTTGEDPSVLLRLKDDYDGAEPAGNSVAALNLARLARMTGLPEYERRADRLLAAFSRHLRQVPSAMPALLSALELRLAAPRQIVIAGARDADDTRALLRAVHARYQPHRILLLADGGEGQALLSRYFAFIEEIRPVGGKAAAYICENGVCRPPITDPAELFPAEGRPKDFSGDA